MMDVDEENEKEDPDYQEIRHHLDEAQENAWVNASWGTMGVDLGEVSAKLSQF